MTFDEYLKILDEEISSKKTDCFLENSYNNGDYLANNNLKFVYEFKHIPQYDTIFKNFNLADIAGNGDTLSKALNIMQWVSNKTQFCGYSKFGVTTPEKIVDFSFDKGFDGAINCANKSILLSDALMSIGIYAMPVWLDNHIFNIESEYFLHQYCHVVTHLFYTEQNKWIMLDPSFNAYFEENDVPLNIIEIWLKNHQKNDIKLKQYELNGTEFFKENYIKFLLSNISEISVFPGNDYKYRYDWGKQYQLWPESLFNVIKEASESSKISKKFKKYLIWLLKSRKMGLNEFLLPPCISKGTLSLSGKFPFIFKFRA